MKRSNLRRTSPGILSGTGWLAVLTLGGLLAPSAVHGACGTEAAASTGAEGAEITMPPFPYVPNETIVVDPELIEQMAGDYCGEEAAPSGEDFLFGYLPLTTFDGMCGATDSEVAAYLGNLYLSGYFGGIWLRDSLDEDARALVQDAAAHHAFPENGPRSLRPGDGALFRLLARAVAAQVAVAEQGGAVAVMSANRMKLPALLSIYGYNLGYTRFMLASPPDGVEPMSDLLVCGDYVLDCMSPEIPLDLLNRFRPALGPLQHPYSVLWSRMDALVQTYAAGSVATGEEVWEDIMASSTISPDVYPTLMRLSVGFLLVSDASALGGITAWATQDVASGRCALLVQAGLTVWSVSYFMGLVSGAPEGTAVSLACETNGL